jgi:glucose uptake protein GlcU
MFITDPKTTEKSVTLTAFVLGFFVAIGKLALSGIQLTDKVKIEQFSGSDFGMVVAALGAIYTLRRYKKDEKKE